MKRSDYIVFAWWFTLTIAIGFMVNQLVLENVPYYRLLRDGLFWTMRENAGRIICTAAGLLVIHCLSMLLEKKLRDAWYDRWFYVYARRLGWFPIQFCMGCGRAFYAGFPTRRWRPAWQEYCSQQCCEV